VGRHHHPGRIRGLSPHCRMAMGGRDLRPPGRSQPGLGHLTPLRR
jgi:hypothetical protein